MARVTLAQKRCAARIKRRLKRENMIEIVRENIRKENEYMEKQEKAQKPTRKQMETEFNI